MKKLFLALGLLAAVALATPAPADAHFSLAIGLPGFGLFVHEPYPRAVVVAPPVYYQPPVYYSEPPVYYSPPVYYRQPVFRHRGCHRGWYKHHRDWDDD